MIEIMSIMNKKCKLNVPVFLTFFLLMSWANIIVAQNGYAERYNLAVYATGTQDDQPLSPSLQTVVQNKTITKLTGEGNYRLIERSNEFLIQINREQKMQQSGDVADNQIAEIGAGYGAEKICVVSITIIDKYLYIATRIVDVATKTSYESGDAEVTNYTSVPVLTQALEQALNKMLTGKTEKTQPATVSSPKQEYNPTTVSGYKAGYDAYVSRLKAEKGGFLDMNSMAYKEYRKYMGSLISGTGLSSLGFLLTTGGVLCHILVEGWVWAAMWGSGVAVLTVGIVQLSIMNNHLKRSYNYYLNGDQRAVSMQFYPYYGGNNTFGAGLSLRF